MFSKNKNINSKIPNNFFKVCINSILIILSNYFIGLLIHQSILLNLIMVKIVICNSYAINSLSQNKLREKSPNLFYTTPITRNTIVRLNIWRLLCIHILLSILFIVRLFLFVHGIKHCSI